MDAELQRGDRGGPRKVALLVGILAAAVAAFFTHGFLAVLATQACTVGFDTSSEATPALASPQGWLCSEEASTVGLMIWYGGYVLSLVVTVAVIAIAWRRWSWRAGVPALALIVVMPLVTAWVLDLPSDDCDADARAANPRWACHRG